MKSTAWRVAFSIGVGVVMFAVTFLSAWRLWASHLNFDLRYRYFARQGLDALKADLLRYRETNGVFPATLKDLCEGEDPDSRNLGYRIVDGVAYDPWDSPYVYEPRDSGFDLYSLGRDGKLGGVGLDADLHADGRGFTEGGGTLGEFFAGRSAPMALRISIGSGLVAMALAAWMARTPPPGRTKREHVARLVITTIGACVVLWYLVLLHTASSH